MKLIFAFIGLALSIIVFAFAFEVGHWLVAFFT